MFQPRGQIRHCQYQSSGVFAPTSKRVGAWLHSSTGRCYANSVRVATVCIMNIPYVVRSANSDLEIADQLAIAETTVNFQIKNIVDKLGANDRTHAVTIAVCLGLLTI